MNRHRSLRIICKEKQVYQSQRQAQELEEQASTASLGALIEPESIKEGLVPWLSTKVSFWSYCSVPHLAPTFVLGEDVGLRVKFQGSPQT